MKLTAVFALLAFVGSALADSTSIVSALSTVNNSTVQLGSSVTEWKGDLLGTLPIIADSTALLVDVKKGTKTAEESEPLDAAGAIEVATATNTLVASVNATLTALIDSKEKFDRLLLSPLIFGNLELQQKATSEMSDAIIKKVPVELQDLARNLVAPIDSGFEMAIDAFRPDL
ncbi:hydrophobic surface binding protein A-domain-containing protein [Achaetomium macrosporum]|uniref:Hydrophobic surface binding protein A-domain-containing protein n=1 Tax=Achaetomium macrosporum TaxID=79813 RepID=A0AAN7C7B2_9PEZI|nr:hydrophobic surface binding protein A-domain-containing protein [Achaetomium macrosporum]